MSLILAIDPGNEKSAFVIFNRETKKIQNKAILQNEELLKYIKGMDLWEGDSVAIEMIACMGMPVGRTVFETCVWIGRFTQAILTWQNREATWVYRKDVKMFLCGTNRAKDGNVRQAIIDLFPGTGGGKTPQIGVKKEPGPLFGMAKDLWAALGVALTHANDLDF